MATQFGPNIWERGHNAGSGSHLPPTLSKPLLRWRCRAQGNLGEPRDRGIAVLSHPEQNASPPAFPGPPPQHLGVRGNWELGLASKGRKKGKGELICYIF